MGARPESSRRPADSIQHRNTFTSPTCNGVMPDRLTLCRAGTLIALTQKVAACYSLGANVAIHNKCSGLGFYLVEGLDPCKGETLMRRLMIVAMVVGCLGAFAFGQTANAVLTG